MKKTVKVLMEGTMEVEMDWYPDEVSNDPRKIIEFDLENDAAALMDSMDSMDIEMLSAKFLDKSKKEHQAEQAELAKNDYQRYISELLRP